MTTAFNRLLVNPATDELAAALDEASGNAPSPQSARRWRPILDEVAANAEGRSQLEHLSAAPGGVRFLAAAWWTDHLGRKLVRACGGHTGAGHQRHHSRLDRDPRPPAWHVGPERVYRAHRPGREPVWLACCACGEVGPPANIAWTGERCGGCHDRREEGLILREPPTLFNFDRHLVALAFAPDSRHIAVSSPDRSLEVLDLWTGAHTPLLHGGHAALWEVRQVAWSPDGRWIAAVDAGDERIRLWEWAEGRVTRPDPLDTTHDEGGGWGVALAFSPDGAHLAAAYDDGRVLLYRCEGDWPTVGEWFTRRDPPPVTALAFSPDGTALIVGRRGGALTTLSVATAEEVDWLELNCPGEDVALVEPSLDGAHLLLLTVPSDEVDPDLLAPPPETATLQLWSRDRRAELRSQVLLPPTLVAFSTAAHHLAWVTHHPNRSPSEVVLWDVARWRAAGSLEWDCEDQITALAFSPDGETLTTGSQGGALKLWPWRRLLEG